MFDFLAQKFSNLFSVFGRDKKLSPESIDTLLAQVQDSLIEADVPLDVARAFVDDVRAGLAGMQLHKALKADEQIMKVVYEKLESFLGGGAPASAASIAIAGKQASEKPSEFAFLLPSTVLVMGLQGSGKTTTIAKLAAYVLKQARDKGKKRAILLASVDFYRPAAIDQLEILAKQASVDFYRAQSGQPVDAAQEILAYAKKHSYDLLFIDTAGRLHVDETMLVELQAIEKQVNAKYKFLVLDSMTGQESLRVARAFDKAVEFTGAILTKMDSDTRGGAAFSFRYALKKPILFVGSGEKLADLDQFRPERMASRMLGMGDLATLVEKAQAKVTHAEKEKSLQELARGQFTLDDFAKQLETISGMGSLAQILKYLPGAAGARVPADALEQGEREMKQFRAIMSSMTRKERLLPKILDASRKKRIANGAGVRLADVDGLLNRFLEAQKFMKQFGKMNRFF
jgi:signal recognition particle subunit SRP54